MTPGQHWISLVNQVKAARRCGNIEAWRIAAEAHPDAAILAGACGKSAQSVQFFNARLPVAAGAERNGGRTNLQPLIDAKMKAGMNYGTAYNTVMRENPSFANSTRSVNVVLPGSSPVRRAEAGANGSPLVGTRFANDGGATLEAPIAGPPLKALFRLPQTISQAEFSAAWAGNGNAVAPINPGKIFAALVDFWQAQGSLDYAAALAKAKGLYPSLWEMVEAIEKAV